MTIMTAKLVRQNSNWHRLLHLLDRNGGMLYLAQLYKPRKHQPTHDDVITDGMPKMTEAALLSYAARYEKRAQWLGWVSIQYVNNRSWVTLLPKGREVLKAFRDGKNWDVEKKRPIAKLLKYTKQISLQSDAG